VRATGPGESARGNRPLFPRSVTPKAPGHHWCGSTSAAAPWPPIGAPLPSLPLHRLDQDSIESPGVATASHQPALGFCLFPVSAPPLGGRKGRVGEEEEGREETVRRVAAGASLLGNRRERKEPDEGDVVRDRGGAGPERGTTVNTDTDAAPPPTPSLRRLHRRPAVSTVATPSPCADILPCPCLWARLRAATCRARRAAVSP
jgi:hypothetical protein